MSESSRCHIFVIGNIRSSLRKENLSIQKMRGKYPRSKVESPSSQNNNAQEHSQKLGATNQALVNARSRFS